MTDQPLLSIVIPVYNEERCIGKTLTEVFDYFNFKNYNYEVIVIDDGSYDRTVNLLGNIAREKDNLIFIKNLQNRGKGYCIKKGVLQSKGEYILFSDADLSTPIEEWEKLLLWIKEGYDIVIGSRAVYDADINIWPPWYRKHGGILFNRLVQLFVLDGICDTQCGFKCFKSQVAKEIFSRQRLSGFAFDVEILYIAKKYKYRIKEVGVIWNYSKNSKVHFIRDGIRMSRDLISIRLNDLKGLYE